MNGHIWPQKSLGGSSRIIPLTSEIYLWNLWQLPSLPLFAARLSPDSPLQYKNRAELGNSISDTNILLRGAPESDGKETHYI